MRTKCGINYYACKVNHLKQTKHKQWWAKVKGIRGATSPSGLDSLVSHLQIENLDQMSVSDIANAINDSFLDPMKEYNPLNDLDL